MYCVFVRGHGIKTVDYGESHSTAGLLDSIRWAKREGKRVISIQADGHELESLITLLEEKDNVPSY